MLLIYRYHWVVGIGIDVRGLENFLCGRFSFVDYSRFFALFSDLLLMLLYFVFWGGGSDGSMIGGATAAATALIGM